jgi:2-polyprenyl-3-methyl-5-hydroxy-6-metoxy-1,4-benzoquinol methylase
MERMFSSKRLELHYNTKYEAEGSNALIQFVEYTPFPSNRFEACLKFFLTRFKEGDILELGAGSGLLARSLISHGLKFNTYTLSELSSNRLKGLSQSFDDPRISVIELDAEAIDPEKFSAYNAIIMLALIEHLIDPLGAMRQIHKLLKPNGLVYVETPNMAKFTRRAKLLVGRFPSTASKNEGLTTYGGTPVDLHDEGHLHYFTYRSLSTMLIERCGFSRVEKYAYFVGPNGRQLYGHKFAYILARHWPELFSEIIVVAYA